MSERKCACKPVQRTHESGRYDVWVITKCHYCIEHEDAAQEAIDMLKQIYENAIRCRHKLNINIGDIAPCLERCREAGWKVEG